MIIVADVLEHLRGSVEGAAHAAQSGRRRVRVLAVSVPNLRFYRLVGNLVLRGEFEYERWGVRDWTHLRWFTRRSLARMLRGKRHGSRSAGSPRGRAKGRRCWRR